MSALPKGEETMSGFFSRLPTRAVYVLPLTVGFELFERLERFELILIFPPRIWPKEFSRAYIYPPDGF
jgi:hypothetical protein